MDEVPMTGFGAISMVAVLVGLCVSASGCRNERNPVVDYLDGAEVQYETEQQKENIINALNDALNLPAAELQGKRYRDYQGSDGQWDLPTVISRHFVPSSPEKHLGQDFYRDITSVAGRNKVADVLELLK